MRNKYLILLLCIVGAVVVFFIISASLINNNLSRISRIDTRIRRTQEQLNSAKVLNDVLKEVSKVIENSLTANRELSIEEANNFVRELTELANNYHIAIHSVFPKVAFAQGRILEQQFSMELETTYVQLGQFLASVERYEYLLKVNSLDVRPQTDKYREDANGNRETLYRVALDMSIFKIVKEA
jgi:Tfp pilus assembly protein PilO